MIVDTSVLVALMREEPETARFVPILLRETGKLRMSAASYVETSIVVDSNDDPILRDRLDWVIQHFMIEIVPVSVRQAQAARDAYRNFGKGRHPARLNFGDCFAYALARTTADTLLFKGKDFTQTDVQIASSPDDR